MDERNDCAWCSNTVNPDDYWMIERIPPFYAGSDLRFHALHCIVDYLAAHGIYQAVERSA